MKSNKSNFGAKLNRSKLTMIVMSWCLRWEISRIYRLVKGGTLTARIRREFSIRNFSGIICWACGVCGGVKGGNLGANYWVIRHMVSAVSRVRATWK